MKIARKRGFAALLVMPAILMLSVPNALAQDSSAPETAAKIISPSNGLAMNLGIDNPNFTSNILDLPAESVGSTLFKLDLADTGCFGCSDRS